MKTKLIESKSSFTKQPSTNIIVSSLADIIKVNANCTLSLPIPMIGGTSLKIFLKTFKDICYILLCCPFRFKSEHIQENYDMFSIKHGFSKFPEANNTTIVIPVKTSLLQTFSAPFVTASVYFVF